jgi:hypothetical protein
MRTKLRSKITLLFVVCAVMLALPAVALASSVDVAVVDVDIAPANSVDLKPGSSSNININMSVTGNQAGTATFEVYRDWTLSGGTFQGSNPQEFTVAPRAGGDPATTFSTSGTITVDSSQANGNYTLAAGVFDITNNNTSGGKLAAGSSSNYVVKVDGIKPTITLTTPANNASYAVGQTVNASYSCADETNGSGLKSCVGDVANGAALDTSTAGPHTFTVQAEDKAGNKESVTHNYTVVSPDSTPPVITLVVTPTSPDGSNGWYKSNVTVSWTVTDPESVITNKSASCDATTNINTDTTGQTVTCSATSAGGSDTKSVTIKLDKTAPSVNCGSADGNWHASDVSIGCTASDNVSDLANAGDASFQLSTNVPPNTEDSNAFTNSKDVLDKAGNSAQAGPIGPNMVDKKAPTITLTKPADGDSYIVGQVVNANYSCSDGGSDTASCAGDVADGAAIDTSFGPHSFQVNATDNVGNMSSVSHAYGASYAFVGWLQPVDGDGSATSTLNIGKVGRTYPIKWQLKEYVNGNVQLISDTAAQNLVGSMSGGQKSVSCSSFSVNDTDVLESSLTGGTALRYDASSDQFIYNYKAPSTQGCYAFAIKNADGDTIKQANFQFTK